MTEAFLPADRFAETDFNIGRVFNRTFAIFSRNLLPFCLISFVANLPNVVFYAPRMGLAVSDGGTAAVMMVLGGLGTMVFGTLSQAILLYGAFDDMRGRRVDIAESLKVGLRRFFPVLAVAICVPVLTSLAAIALLFPGLMVLTQLFVSAPVCVVERLGPIKSMGRSARLTKGHRWKIFGLWFAALVVGAIAQSFLEGAGRGIGGAAFGVLVLLLWGGVFGAFNAILAVVTYHDLRVAKEGVDTNQIAAVFD